MNDLSLSANANWVAVCALDDIVPDTGVCALLHGRHVAVFRVGDAAPRVYAIDNVDPNAGASVLSRGLVGSLGERVVVAPGGTGGLGQDGGDGGSGGWLWGIGGNGGSGDRRRCR